MLTDRSLIRDAVYDLKVAQDRRRYAIKQMQKLMHACLSFTRNAFGFDVALPEDERDDICERSRQLVKTLLSDEVDLLSKTDPVDDIYELASRQEIEQARDMVEFCNQALIPWARDKEQAIGVLEDRTEQLPIWEWAETIKGIGSNTMGKLIGEVGHDSDDHEGIAFEQFATKYKLFKWFCLHVNDGRRGQDGDHERKSEVYMAITNCICNTPNPYEPQYRERKAYTEENRPDWNGMRRELDARMVAGKQLLTDVWKEWRKRTPSE